MVERHQLVLFSREHRILFYIWQGTQNEPTSESVMNVYSSVRRRRPGENCEKLPRCVKGRGVNVSNEGVNEMLEKQE